MFRHFDKSVTGPGETFPPVTILVSRGRAPFGQHQETRECTETDTETLIVPDPITCMSKVQVVCLPRELVSFDP